MSRSSESVLVPKHELEIKRGIMLPTGEFITKDTISRWPEEHRSEFLNNLYLEMGDTWKIPTKQIFPENIKPRDIVDAFMEICVNPEYLHFTCKHILNMNLFPYQMSIVKTMWTKTLPMLIASRGAGKTSLLAVYLTLRALIDQGVKIVIAGGGLRQAGLVIGAMQQIWQNAPVLRDICGSVNEPKRTNFGYEWRVGQSLITAVPVGSSGDKIRGLRANIAAVDEFSVVNPEIFETVIRGFAAVSSKNTFETVQQAYQEILLEELGIINEDPMQMRGLNGNQIIISGTATYQFNHFYKYFERYCKVIENKGKVESITDPEEYHNYAVIRIPYDKLPPKLMDKSILSQGSAMMDSTIFKNEYGCIFSKDSDGFYPATVVYGSQCPLIYNGEEIDFGIELEGEKNALYVMGIDPASERDNLTITIVKIMNGYRAHVYTWKANRKLFEQDKEKYPHLYKNVFDYNTFIINKLHEILRRFNIVRIHMDAGGGGVPIIEGLKDPTKVPAGANCIYDMEDENVAGLKGLHIIKLCHFSNRDWYEGSHTNLLVDLTTRTHIFPYYDQIEIAKEVEILAANYGQNSFVDSLIIDSYENVSSNIEEVKYQTVLIQEQVTAKGYKTWDLPKIKGVMTEDLKTKLKKDHFTSLLLANDAARDYLKVEEPELKAVGGVIIHSSKPRQPFVRTGQKYIFSGEKNVKLRNEQNNKSGPVMPIQNRVIRRGTQD